MTYKGCYGRSEAGGGCGFGTILDGRMAKSEKDGESMKSGPERRGCGRSKTGVRAGAALRLAKWGEYFVPVNV